MTTPRSIIAAFFIALFSFACLGEAQANCGCIEPRVVDTIPRDGDTQVPTNVGIMVSASGCLEKATIDGRGMTTIGPNYFEPSFNLEPNTDYEIEFEFLSLEGENLTHSVSFRTGDGESTTTAPAPQLAEAEKLSSLPSELSLGCRALPSSFGCPDTGNPVFYRFDTAETPRAWYVEGQGDAAVGLDGIWPSACGPPVAMSYQAASGCLVVRALDDSGQLSESTKVCLENSMEPEDPGNSSEKESSDESAGSGMSDDSGCSATSNRPGEAALVIFLLGLFSARRARTGSSSS